MITFLYYLGIILWIGLIVFLTRKKWYEALVPVCSIGGLAFFFIGMFAPVETSIKRIDNAQIYKTESGITAFYNNKVYIETDYYMCNKFDVSSFILINKRTTSIFRIKTNNYSLFLEENLTTQ